MAQAIALAKSKLGTTFPNPTVACLIVKDKEIISSGVTAKGGRPHAEIQALNQLKDARNCTAYITLEPCCHHGQTSPCINSLIDAAIERVVIAVTDPDTRVSGKSIELLIKKNIKVTYGILEEEATSLNIGFFKNKLLNLPLLD